MWTAPTTTPADRKQIVRSVIDEITVAVQGVSELVDVTIGWAGDLTTTVVIRQPLQRTKNLSYYPKLAARMVEFADAGLHPATIAAPVTADGFLPNRGSGPIRWRLVDQILRRHQHPIAYRREPLPTQPDEAPGDHEWFLPQLAAELAVTTGTIRAWLRKGSVTGQHESRPPHRWILRVDLTNSPSCAHTWNGCAAEPPGFTRNSPTIPRFASHRRSLLDRWRTRATTSATSPSARPQPYPHRLRPREHGHLPQPGHQHPARPWPRKHRPRQKPPG